MSRNDNAGGTRFSMLAALLFMTFVLFSFVGAVCPAGRANAAAQGRVQPGNDRGKVVVLLLDGVSVEEFPSAATPFCLQLAESWSSGLMMTRSEGQQGLGGEYVSLGAGVRAAGAPGSGLSYNSDEKLAGYLGATSAGDYYSKSTGNSAAGNSVVCLNFQLVRERNRDLGREDNVGLLGSTLRKSGHETAVLGNSDAYRRPNRPAPLVCADSAGEVTSGNVGPGLLLEAPASPGGYVTDIDRMVREAAGALSGSDLLVVDSGDTARVEEEAGVTGDGTVDRQRSAALRRFDDLASRLYGLIDTRSSLFIILSPEASARARAEGNYLTPMIAAGRGFSRGVVTSSSTRRRGVIDNEDVMPTILNIFSVTVPSKVTGSSMKTVEASGSLGYLRGLSSQLDITRKARWPVVVSYVALVILLVLLTAALIFSRRRPSRLSNAGTLEKIIEPAACVLTAAPLAFLLVSAFSYRGYLFPALFCLMFSVVLGFAAWLLLGGRKLDPVTFLCLVTVAVVVASLFAGNRLTLFPVLGVSSLEGMRFFGLPNSIVGVLLAAAVLGAAGIAAGSLSNRRNPGEGDLETVTYPAGACGHSVMNRRIIPVGLLLLTFVIGLGLLGANLGGFIVAGVTFILFAILLSSDLTGWRVAAAAGATIIGTAIVVLLDSLFFHTHTGRAATGGAARLFPIIERKIAIELGQIRYLLLPAIMLMVAVFILVIWMRRPSSFWASLWKSSRPLMAALYAVLVGSILALLFKDTGIAMMGTMMLVTATVLSYHVSVGNLVTPACRTAR